MNGKNVNGNNCKKYAAALLCLVCAAMCFAQNTTVKIASVAPVRSPWDTEQKLLAQKWSKLSGGSVTMQFFSTSALGGESGVIQKMRAVRPGQRSPLDGAVFTSVGFSEFAPESNMLTLCMPFLFRSQDEVDLILETFSDRIEKTVSEQGFVLLGWFNIGWAYFFTKEPVRTPEELKKLKLVVGGITSPALGAAFKTVGFNTEDIPDDKLMQSLKSPNGVKGLYTIPMYAYAARYYETLPYVIEAPLCPVMTAFVISEKTWNSIPESYRPALRAAVKEAEQKFVAVQRTSDAENLDLLEAAGMTRIVLSPEETALWERTFSADVSKLTGMKNSVIDVAFYREIEAILTSYRNGMR
ncbi:TRAP transporter substrate-binding protein DctP [Treponema brennaborense]|uniref:Extracellular solute-binding protein, family 7 n=1 Tax=Treponema brennaborense (strain DSM 12168 / CIP 105900 / DD5/3) TaxID=906968 RepID=F4LJ23_TREBD|nr:TRAP transporter substrate-binding protein DctP [Treponema brennaborense]AEE17332.1 Extracellular solute-binding protein, family 7 [Treponema brennaborense DSM 12168]